MTQEEKAKAYDEAIERAKNFIENGDERERTIAESIFAGIMEESEDERIRQFLIHEVTETSDEIMSYRNMNKKDVLTWIEKQGEQKPAAWSEEDEKNFNEAISYIKDTALRNWLISFKGKVQPNQEWSEEDERLCQCIIEDQEEALDKVRNDKYGHSEIISDLKEMYHERINFLKSLKERVQPMQEWSEEDRLHYMNVLEALEYVKGCKSDYDKIEAVKSDIAWFKSIRPQNKWKPSDEQLDALYDVLNPCDGVDKKALESLYEQLKAL